MLCRTGELGTESEYALEILSTEKNDTQSIKTIEKGDKNMEGFIGELYGIYGIFRKIL